MNPRYFVACICLLSILAYSCSKQQTAALQSSAVQQVALTPIINHYVSFDQATSIAQLHSMFSHVRGSGDGIHSASQLAVTRTQATPIAKALQQALV